nr:MAG: hypothetical protein [Bacteriophage sp.]
MHRIFRVKAYEAEHGPHFNEEHARKAVSKMENEDGTRGPHWSVEETTALASQYGINLGSRFNRYDWFVALNMVYSDYYLMQAINGNKEAISSLSNTLNCDINAVQTALNTINSGVSQISCDTKLSSCEVINAITSGNASLASELANCCCTTQRSIDAVNNNITKMGYENQLSVCNQTNNLVNTMNSNTLALRDSGTANTQSIIAKLDAMQNQALLDKIDSLRERNSTLLTQLSQEHQTATFGNMISSATAPIVTKLNSLQSDVDGIKCKLPNTVSVPYPQLSCYNPEIFRAAAMGAYAGDAAFNGVGYNSGCGCGC